MRGYTDEQMAWLKTHAIGNTWERLTAEYNERYKQNHSVNRLKTHCNRHGIFVSGQLNGKSSWNAKPIGHICPTSTGYARVKTETGYKMLARVNMPETVCGLVCCHFDGDKMSANAKYYSKQAMRLYALQCRYNKGFKKYRETAMQVCELDVAIKNLKEA